MKYGSQSSIGAPKTMNGSRAPQIQTETRRGSLIGRPTKYRPEYCDAVVDYMSQGYSKTAFAGKIGVSRETLYEWSKEHPEFSYAVKIGETARTAALEEQLLAEDEGPRVTARIFALKNACPSEWREKQDVHVTDERGPMVSITVNMDPQEAMRAYQEMLRSEALLIEGEKNDAGT